LEAHGVPVSLVGHITAQELRRDLDTINYANGFGNRFMWTCVRRSKSLPHGGRFHLENTSELVTEIRACLDFARWLGGSELLTLDEEASELWESVYDELTEGKPGLLGAMVARGAPIVLRLAGMYCLLDQQAQVQPPHLRAALALWRYCEESATYIFGDSLGDPMADQILARLRIAEDGMTRTEISQSFGRNKDASEIGHALDTLAESELARMVMRREGIGRPAEVWIATKH